MAFPVIEGSRPTEGSFTTSQNINLPFSVAAGELLLAMMAKLGPSSVVTWPSGWVPLFDTFDSAGSGMGLAAAYKLADGSEGGAQPTVNHSVGVTPMTLVYRISGWHGTIAPEAGTTANGSSAAANPPALTPLGWAQTDTLWICSIAIQSGDGPYDGYPAAYNLTRVTVGNNHRVFMCARQLNAASDDPAAWSNANALWLAQTIAVPPVGAAPPSSGPGARSQGIIIF